MKERCTFISFNGIRWCRLFERFLLNGKRRKAYVYFLALFIWPVIVFFGHLLLSVEGSLAVSNSGIALLLVVGFVAIWSISVAQAIRDRRLAVAQTEVTYTAGRTWEIAALTIGSYALILYSVVSLAVMPYLPRGKAFELLHLTSKPATTSTNSVPKVISAGDGDLVLAGVVMQDDRARGGIRLLLMFQEGFRTQEIKTNSGGEFEFRLPPGNWRFAGPLIFGEESRPVYVVFKPEIAKPEFRVGVGPPTRKLHMRIVTE